MSEIKGLGKGLSALITEIQDEVDQVVETKIINDHQESYLEQMLSID